MKNRMLTQNISKKKLLKGSPKNFWHYCSKDERREYFSKKRGYVDVRKEDE